MGLAATSELRSTSREPVSGGRPGRLSCRYVEMTGPGATGATGAVPRPPRRVARKVALTVHVLCSVGWVGAVGAFLSLIIVGLTTSGAGRAALLVAAAVVTQAVIVPLAVASTVSGVMSSLLSPWGLVRHYWVLTKLGLTIAATVVLLLQLGPILALGEGPVLDQTSGSSLASPASPLPSLLLHAGGGLVVLIVITVLGLWKPRGQVRPRRLRWTGSA